MKLFILGVSLLLLPFAARGQGVDPVAASPDKYKVLLENEFVRVVRYDIKPGERDQLHTHPAKVSYVLSGETLRISLGDSSFVTEEPAGKTTYMGAVPPHFATNVGTTPVTIILVEPKKIVDQAVPAADDPLANNPKTLKVLLENESVRVMEAQIPPGWKEKPHSHPGYVTYIVKGGTVRMHFADGTARDVSFNTGEAKFTAPVTHWAENVSADSVKIILVELRHK